MHKIDTENNFLIWALEVNRSHKMCDLQDIYAHSMPDVLHRLFFDMSKNNKHLVVFAIQKCMGSESLLSLLQSFISKRINNEIEAHLEQWNNEWSKIKTKEYALKIDREGYENRIKQLEKDNEYLTKKLTGYQGELPKLHRHNIELQSEIEALNKELKKQYSFESHIKELLKAA